jgi:hypothetical protein
VDDLLARLSGSGIFIQGYADDICLLAVGKFPNTLSGLMQWALSTVETWCNEVGLTVNHDKTGLVAFTKKRKLQGFFEPYFFGARLSLSGSVKYLGVTLDSRLTWREHVEVKVKKACMEPESSPPYPQVPATCPYPEPTPSSPHDPLQLTEDTS